MFRLNNIPMQLRPMTMDDADFMLSLKNDPDTRNFALLTSEVIKREDHIKFLEKNIDQFQVIEDNGAKAGALRVQDNEISIWLDKDFRGRGLASKAIKRSKYVGMKAKIVCGNIKSLQAFIGEGFFPVEFIHAPVPHYILIFGL